MGHKKWLTLFLLKKSTLVALKITDWKGIKTDVDTDI